MAANDLSGIRNVTFSSTSRLLQNRNDDKGIGFYNVYVDAGAYVAVAAANYQTGYYYQPQIYAGQENNVLAVYLSYIGGWPQTYG